MIQTIFLLLLSFASPSSTQSKHREGISTTLISTGSMWHNDLSSSKHPYFVSITQIDFNPQNHNLEISIKLFSADLDEALTKRFGKKMELNASNEAKEINTYIKQYLQEHFSLNVNKQKVDVQYIGKEKEDDATWCYLEVPNVDALHTILINNSIFTEVFDSQNNITHVKVGKQQKSTILSRRKLQDELSF